MSPLLPKGLRQWSSTWGTRISERTAGQRQLRFRRIVAAVGLAWVGVLGLVFFVLPSYGETTLRVGGNSTVRQVLPGVAPSTVNRQQDVTLFHADPAATVVLFALVVLIWLAAVLEFRWRRMHHRTGWGRITVGLAVVTGLWTVLTLVTIGPTFAPLVVVLGLLALPLDQQDTPGPPH